MSFPTVGVGHPIQVVGVGRQIKVVGATPQAKVVGASHPNNIVGVTVAPGTGTSGGGVSTAGQPIGLLLILTKAA